MNIQKINSRVLVLVKGLSAVLTASAIGLESWYIYTVLNHGTVASSLIPIFWIGRIIWGSHLIEGVVAAIYAPFKQKSPIQSGIYTLFVGTVGLLELIKNIEYSWSHRNNNF
jgi:hypothetical protein